ncbi:hypothetical protein BJY52DRAFT_1225142 [Lactarius psammicola]|nr:hypothetical protein BJY52DRAFT_1225142 [Lactarius psammicola]
MRDGYLGVFGRGRVGTTSLMDRASHSATYDISVRVGRGLCIDVLSKILQCNYTHPHRFIREDCTGWTGCRRRGRRARNRKWVQDWQRLQLGVLGRWLARRRWHYWQGGGGNRVEGGLWLLALTFAGCLGTNLDHFILWVIWAVKDVMMLACKALSISASPGSNGIGCNEGSGGGTKATSGTAGATTSSAITFWGLCIDDATPLVESGVRAREGGVSTGSGAIWTETSMAGSERRVRGSRRGASGAWDGRTASGTDMPVTAG